MARTTALSFENDECSVRHMLQGMEGDQTAFLTNPDRRQRVQTRIRLWLLPTTARTVWILGLNTRRVLLLAWLTLFPEVGFF